MVKLNKNQRRFFVAAINHYGDASNDVRLKDLRTFAEENDLIVPISALKEYCQEEDLVRGHYNLLLTGIEPPEPEPEPKPMGEFRTTEDVIVDTSAYAEPPAPKRRSIKKFKPEKGQNPLKWRNPVYVITNHEGSVIAVTDSPTKAYEKRWLAFRDNGLMDYEDFAERMKYVGAAIIPSANSQLTCVVEMKEVE